MWYIDVIRTKVLTKWVNMAGDYLDKYERDEDCKMLSLADQEIINEIKKLVGKLSSEGREYWSAYYG